MRNQKKSIRWIIAIVLLLASVLPAAAQKLTVESMEVAPFDLTAASKPVYDYNNVACGLVKVFLAADGAEFGGNIIKPVKREVSQYLVYMTAGSKMLNIQCPGYIPLMVNFRDYGIQRIESQQTYVLTLLMPSTANAPVDDGMRYLAMHVSPANATVFVDDEVQTVNHGTVSVLLPRGIHTYRVVASGYISQTGEVEIAGEKKSLNIVLESALAQITVNCPTTGAQVYVNDELKGNVPWNGQLSAGNYQIEARLDGYRPQRQNVTVAQRENRAVSIPALTAITGTLNVNYQPMDAEVWIDGKRVGTSPDVFRNVLVGTHNVEVRAKGYQTDKKTVTISEGQTEQLRGSLAASTTASSSTTHATVPVPEAVDLGLSVKWASFNLGASKPEEYGYYYKWGETTPADNEGWNTYKYAKGDWKRLKKYCTNSAFGNNDFTDGKTKLEHEDDAAAVNLNGLWRMPTFIEMRELTDKCKREWTKVNGINGVRVIGPNGNSIFIPASGIGGNYDEPIEFVGSSGWLWSSISDGEEKAYYLYFDSNKWSQDCTDRSCGTAVRPVFAE